MRPQDKFYDAPKPTKTWKAWAKIILPRVIFPPILLWDALKYTVNKSVGEMIGLIVLPAQKVDFSGHVYALPSAIANLNPADSITAERVKVVTHDGAKLDTLEIKYTAEEIAVSDQQYVIRFNGNGECYENHFDRFTNEAKNLKCNVIGFNYRGVNNSTGKPTSKDDLVTDGIAQIQRLLDKGVRAENITLKGHSLGAG